MDHHVINKSLFITAAVFTCCFSFEWYIPGLAPWGLGLIPPLATFSGKITVWGPASVTFMTVLKYIT